MKSMFRIWMFPLIVAPFIRCGDAPTQPPDLGSTPIPTRTRSPEPTPTRSPRPTPTRPPAPPSTRPPAATPTAEPTPPPLQLSGVWTGTLTYGTYFYGGFYADCPDETIRVELYHFGDRIAGNFATRCAGRLYLEGRVGERSGNATHLTVDLWTAGEEIAAGNLTGMASATRISVSSRATTGATKLAFSR